MSFILAETNKFKTFLLDKEQTTIGVDIGRKEDKLAQIILLTKMY